MFFTETHLDKTCVIIYNIIVRLVYDFLVPMYLERGFTMIHNIDFFPGTLFLREEVAAAEPALIKKIHRNTLSFPVVISGDKPTRRAAKKSRDRQIVQCEDQLTFVDFARQRPRKAPVPVLEGQFNLFDILSAPSFVPAVSPKSQPLSANTETPPVALNDASFVDQLMEENVGLVGHLVGRTCANLDADSREDAKQIGMIALWKAAQKFDPARNVKFATYASLVVKRELYKAYAALKPKAGTVSIEALREVEDCPVEFEAADDVSPVEHSEESEVLKMLEELAANAPRIKESNGMRALVMQAKGVAAKEIAHRMGVTEASYSAMISSARKALRSNPKLLNYISLITGKETKATTVVMRGETYSVSYASGADYNHPKVASDDYLEIFAEQFSTPELADNLLQTLHHGGQALFIDAENHIHTEFVMSENKILVASVKSIRSSVALIRDAAKRAGNITANTMILDDDYMVTFKNSCRRNKSSLSGSAVVAALVRLVNNDDTANELLDTVRYGETTSLEDNSTGISIKFVFSESELQIVSARNLRDPANHADIPVADIEVA